MTAIGLITFFVPYWQPFLSWPALSKFLAWYWWIILGLLILWIVTAWEAAKRMAKITKENQKNADQFSPTIGNQTSGGHSVVSGRDTIFHPPASSPVDVGEIDISLEPLSRESGEYVSLRVTNHNLDNPIFCKAIIRKKEWFDLDPTDVDGGKWMPIDTDEDGPLTWHHGNADSEGFRKIHFEPGFINIARAWAKRDMNFALRGHMMFTHIVEKPAKAGRYKVWIDVYCKMEGKSKVETWIGCIDMVNPMRSDMLTIMECEDVKDWKQDQATR